MQNDYVAREQPNEVRSMEISLCSGKRMNNKADKWGGLVFGFSVEYKFSRKEVKSLSPIEVQRNPMRNVLGEAKV